MGKLQDVDVGLPCSIEAEKTILGAILLDNEVFYRDSFDAHPDDFFLDSNRKIYEAISSILFGEVDGVNQADIVTLSNELQFRKKLKDVGGVAYLASLTEGLPIRPQIEGYLSILKDKARLRKLVAICNATSSRAMYEADTGRKLQEGLEQDLLELDAHTALPSATLGSVTPSVEQRVEKFREQSTDRTALNMTWGIDGLDRKTKGIFGGEFTVAGGESGGGKSSFMCQVALANAREGRAVGIFSIEMTKEQLASRFYPLAGDTITADMMRDPRLMNLHTHVPAMRNISAELQRLEIHIDDASPLHIQKLKARIKMMKRRLGVKLFWVDYLQLIRHDERTEVDGIRSVVFQLRDLVKEEPDIHIVLLSQFSQGMKFAKKQKRGKDDLYGGSAIHHAAQNVFIINIEDPEKRDPKDLLDVEINVRKQREGSIGKVSCHFDRDHLRYCYPKKLGEF
jgi:replicative DNA helicase